MQSYSTSYTCHTLSKLKTFSNFSLIAFLVMNIISSVFTIFLIVPESIGIASIQDCFDRDYRRYSRNATTLALYCMMLIIGLVQAIVAIIAAGYSCSAVCCGQNLNHPGTVIYAPNPNTITNSNFVEIPLNTPIVTENENVDQEGNKYIHIYEHVPIFKIMNFMQ